MEAKYEGVCLECGMWFPPKTPIVRHSQFGWKHKNCPPYPEDVGTLVEEIKKLLPVYIMYHPEQCERVEALRCDPDQLPEWIRLAVSKWFENERLNMHESEVMRSMSVEERVRFKREARKRREQLGKEVLKGVAHLFCEICEANCESK